MFKKIIMALALTFSMFSAQAGDYVIEKQGQEVNVSNERYGKWKTYIGELRKWPSYAKRQTLSFEFESDSYFTEDNQGHFFVMLMADNPERHLNGRGVVIGNVSGYRESKGGCYKAPHSNAVVMESFWNTGNCVFGATTASPRLHNNIRYRITIVVEKPPVKEEGRIVRYTLEQKEGGSWLPLAHRANYDDKPINTEHGGWVIGEVFSAHPWTVNIFNLEETIE